ncbi:MAG: hypothetical protein GY714_01810 [Desulfobacterales bacterium]|nr:hypothetical protein [Desulfobacterales bacterium]
MIEEVEGKILDKSKWGSGAWDLEEDKAAWHDPISGYPMCLVRVSGMGHWCGYVGIPRRHPYYRVDYDDNYEYINAHGGLTYASHRNPLTKEHDKYWWYGFDAAHSGDLVPGMAILLKTLSSNHIPEDLFGKDVYRDEFYMTLECQKLGFDLRVVQDNYSFNYLSIFIFYSFAFCTVMQLIILDFNKPWWIYSITLLSIGLMFFLMYRSFVECQKFKHKYNKFN